MSSIFPIRDTVTPDNDREPRLVDLDGDTADEVFEALSSGTTREIFLSLHRNPQTASDLAEATDTSVQNAQYHLGKLSDAELVEVVDTWYSERGTEMKVYAPRDDSLVLFAGRDKQRTLRNLLDRVVGIFTLLLPVSVLAALGADNLSSSAGGDSAGTVNTGQAVDLQETPSGDIKATSQDGLEEPALDAANISPNDSTGATLDQLPVDANDSAVILDNDTALIISDEAARQQSNVTLPSEIVDGTADASVTILGLDPALAVAGGILFGGVLAVLGLTAWYGPATLYGTPGEQEE